MKTVYLFTVTNEEGAKATWWVDMKKKGRTLKIDEGTKPPLKPDVRIELTDRDLVGLATGTVCSCHLLLRAGLGLTRSERSSTRKSCSREGGFESGATSTERSTPRSEALHS